jgi:hypothetical protein
MSIHLRIYLSDGSPTEFIPISSQQTFEEVWLPIAQRAELTLIPKIRTGYPAVKIDDQTIDNFVAEATTLVSFAELDKAISENTLSKMRVLRDKLLWCQENWSVINKVRI